MGRRYSYASKWSKRLTGTLKQRDQLAVLSADIEAIEPIEQSKEVIGGRTDVLPIVRPGRLDQDDPRPVAAPVPPSSTSRSWCKASILRKSIVCPAYCSQTRARVVTGIDSFSNS